VRRWLASYGVEALIVVVGAALRLTFHWHFQVEEGFDAPFHWGVAKYVADHWSIAPRDFNCTAYNPSLYYLAVALGQVWLDADMKDAEWGSIALGIAHLLVFWWGVRRFVSSRLARAVALIVCATLPANLHIDGLLTPETLSKLLCTLALVLAATLLSTDDAARRWRLSAWLGFVLGLAILTKMSVLALVPAILGGGAIDAWFRASGVGPRLRRGAPIATSVGMMLVVAAPLWLDNVRACGHVLPTSFETHQKEFMTPAITGKPIWERQPRSFYTALDPEMRKDPFAPRASAPPEKAEFWSVLVASTFLDHWNFRFCDPPEPGEPVVYKNRRPTRPGVVPYAQRAYDGGLVVFFGTMLAWAASFVVLLRRRDGARMVLLLAPLGALLALLQFSSKYPINYFGVVKGLYMQFGAAPAYALFGVAVGWLWGRPLLRPFAIAGLVAYAPVVAYTLYCRVFTLYYDLFIYPAK
jgi:hypothetical protein